jgi:hypothetical protein
MRGVCLSHLTCQKDLPEAGHWHVAVARAECLCRSLVESSETILAILSNPLDPCPVPQCAQTWRNHQSLHFRPHHGNLGKKPCLANWAPHLISLVADSRRTCIPRSPAKRSKAQVTTRVKAKRTNTIQPVVGAVISQPQTMSSLALWYCKEVRLDSHFVSPSESRPIAYHQLAAHHL